MANIYRKAALDKLSSPEQLDKAITIISPSFWIAAIGGLAIIAVALAWSIFGRLPVKVSADGMYMGSGGLQSVVSEADGIVQEVYVSEGDEVEKGQELAQLDSSAYDEQISALNERRSNVESVTFWSYDDPATADTKPLLDIKSQSDVADSSLSADQISLRERYKALSKQRKVTADAKSKRNSARKRYDKLNKQYANYHYEDKMNAAASAYAAAQNARAAYENNNPPPRTAEQEEALTELKEVEADALKKKQKLETDYQTLQINLKNAESAYSLAQQNYSSEKSKEDQLKDTVSQMEAKVRADKSGTNDQISSLEKQFNSAKGSVLDQIDQELSNQRKSAAKMKLSSRASGKVTGVNIAKGNAVQTGTTICTISYYNDGEETVLFVPVSEGKKIKKGMKVVVYPSTVNRQEYGHMDGKVTGVSDTVVSSQDMINQLGEQSLAQAFTQNGPVIRVDCSLEKDESTASGYKWSSKKGAEIAIDEGTIMQADIVTEEKAPISMLIPYLKEKLTIKHDDKEEK